MDTKHNFAKTAIVGVAGGLESMLGLSSIPILSFIAKAIPSSLYYVFINSVIGFLATDAENVNTLTETINSLLFDNFTHLYSREFTSTLKSNVYSKLTSISKVFVFLYFLVEFLTKFNISPNVFQNLFSYVFSIIITSIKKVLFASVNVPSIYLINMLMAPFEQEVFIKALNFIRSKTDKQSQKDPNLIQKIGEYLNVINQSAKSTVQRLVPVKVQTGAKVLGTMLV
jgi:hypothetical protein